MPKVSIVIPTYKAEKYIERCARSLFGQTLDSIEYIFVDDCSPDNSITVMQKVLEEYPQRKEQVKVIRHEINQGVGAARNHGVEACTGDYIIHCDPDDWVDLTMYETLYYQAVENNADMVYCNFCRCSENETVPEQQSGSCDPATLIEDLLCGISHSSLSNKLFRKEIVFDPSIYCPDNIVMTEDQLRVCQMLLLCNKICYVSRDFYYYRRHSAQMTAMWDYPKLAQQFDVVAILGQKLGARFKSALKSKCRLLALSAIKHRILSTGDFYRHFSGLAAGCFGDKNLTLFRKCAFFAGYCLYFLLPKNLQKDYETLSRQQKER